MTIVMDASCVEAQGAAARVNTRERREFKRHVGEAAHLPKAGAAAVASWPVDHATQCNRSNDDGEMILAPSAHGRRSGT